LSEVNLSTKNTWSFLPISAKVKNGKKFKNSERHMHAGVFLIIFAALATSYQELEVFPF
jgi:hypothetical protein